MKNIKMLNISENGKIDLNTSIRIKIKDYLRIIIVFLIFIIALTSITNRLLRSNFIIMNIIMVIISLVVIFNIVWHIEMLIFNDFKIIGEYECLSMTQNNRWNNSNSFTIKIKNNNNDEISISTNRYIPNKLELNQNILLIENKEHKFIISE